MFFMLPMIDASIDRVEEIDCAPRMDEGGSVQDTETLRYFLRACGLFLWGAENHPRCQLYYPEGTTTAIVDPPAPARHPHQSYGKVLGCGQRTVKLGGINVKDYALDSLMRNFSMVFQRVYLFNDSIENNIKFASRTPLMKRWWPQQRRPGAMISLWRCLTAMTR